MDTRARSIAKTVAWRVIATCLTLVIAYAFTTNLSQTIEFTLTVAVVSMVAYYLHERAWDKISWGRGSAA